MIVMKKKLKYIFPHMQQLISFVCNDFNGLIRKFK
jgi:hypothetical protein